MTYILETAFPVMSDGIVFLFHVFLSALWFGRPPSTTLSPHSTTAEQKKDKCLFQPHYLHLGIRLDNIFPFLH